MYAHIIMQILFLKLIYMYIRNITILLLPSTTIQEEKMLTTEQNTCAANKQNCFPLFSPNLLKKWSWVDLKGLKWNLLFIISHSIQMQIFQIPVKWCKKMMKLNRKS